MVAVNRLPEKLYTEAGVSLCRLVTTKKKMSAFTVTTEEVSQRCENINQDVTLKNKTQVS